MSSHHHHHHHRRKLDLRYMSKGRKVFFAVLILIVIVAVIAGVYTLLSRLEKRLDKTPENAGLALSRTSAPPEDPADGVDEPTTPVIYYNGGKYTYNEGLSTLLILGVDDPELTETQSTENTSQADFLLLAVFDPEGESCTLIQLNRDTMCEVSVMDALGKRYATEYEQLALAHTYGNGLEKSCENTVYTVSRLLYGITIENYFSFTMDAIPILNNLVGGVTVTVEDDFTGIDDTLIKGETVTLTDENVEHFVRSRMGMKDDGTNLARMRRQRSYMTALFSAMSERMKADSSFALDAWAALGDSMVTDCTVNELNEYVENFGGYTLSGIRVPEGELKLGEKYYEFYVDDADLQKLVIDTFYQRVD